MVDSLLKNKLLSFSEAFFIQKIDITNIQHCLDIENAAEKTRSIRTKDEFSSLLTKQNCYGLFNKENKMLAYAFFSQTDNEAELIDINLLKTQQNNGIGSLFLLKCLDILKQEYNVEYVILEVAVDNHQAIKSYHKFNAEQIGIRKNYYQNQDGSKSNAIVLKISL